MESVDEALEMVHWLCQDKKDQVLSKVFAEISNIE